MFITRKQLIIKFNKLGKELRRDVLELTDEEYNQRIGELSEIAELLDGYDRAYIRISNIKSYYDDKRKRGNSDA